MARPTESRRSSGNSDSSSPKRIAPSKLQFSERIPAETFIFVRPPPTLNNHPLNVQIQLFIPQDRTIARPSSSHETPRADTPASGVSAVATATVGGPRGALTPSPPLSRSPSTHSNRSIMSTTSSTGSTVASTRRVAPLYNLNIHSVLLPTTITDAGTDAKVAKILKRGIEVVGLAVLEAAELSASGLKMVNETSPTRSAEAATVDEAKGSADKAGLLNKLKRFSLQRQPRHPPSESPTLDVATSTFAHEPNGLPLFRSRTPEPTVGSEGSTSAAPASKRHATGYVWSVAKFCRSDLAGQEVNVSFEWRKRNKAVSRASSRRRRSTFNSAYTPDEAGLSPSRLPARRSDELSNEHLDVIRANGTHPPFEGDHSPVIGPNESSSDDDSDPEQSETSWSATLVLPERRLRLALLTPAPFHPKLVAQMQMPGNLTSVCIADGVALSAEDLKDVVSCTGLWLIVRESLGGIAKKRKGDGNWRMEAKQRIMRQ